ncbi:4-hydroxy-tetrahydrodipicolinate reductase [Lacticaseibacillus thailandensis]|nr:4-hydroxy-tetrahydrodipicolinate reductase [Lacticaseibacillus thailandensis]
MTTVFVSGASGKMGRRVAHMLQATDDIQVVGGLDRAASDAEDFPIFGSTDDINVTADVWVDFTIPTAARKNAEYSLTHGFDTVIGTSGMSNDDFDALGKLAAANNRKVMIVPNFAISAVLMMQFAAKAAKYMPDAEVVEIHHSDKVDAPSGTARATAQAINKARTAKPIAPKQTDAPARGEWIDNVPVHALRLPGYVAQEEVIFGAEGESLSISQVSYDRSSFMAGIRLAVRKVATLPNALTVGLDSLL